MLIILLIDFVLQQEQSSQGHSSADIYTVTRSFSTTVKYFKSQLELLSQNNFTCQWVSFFCLVWNRCCSNIH